MCQNTLQSPLNGILFCGGGGENGAQKSAVPPLEVTERWLSEKPHCKPCASLTQLLSNQGLWWLQSTGPSSGSKDETWGMCFFSGLVAGDVTHKLRFNKRLPEAVHTSILSLPWATGVPPSASLPGTGHSGARAPWQNQRPLSLKSEENTEMGSNFTASCCWKEDVSEFLFHTALVWEVSTWLWTDQS